MHSLTRFGLAGGVACAMLAVGVGNAVAGGFAVREQSTTHQGASFAGNGVGTSIGSQFWNPAALGNAGYGINTESGYALLITSNEFTAIDDPIAAGAADAFEAFAGLPTTTDTGGIALVPSSYAAYRVNNNLVLGVGLNAPFGLGSEPDVDNWVGAVHGRSTKLTTFNLNPNLAYQVAPGLHVGVGLQLQYAKLSLKFASSTPLGQNAVLDIEDKIGVGFTLGAMWQVSPQTAIGIGFRSSITHDFEGDLFQTISNVGGPVEAELELPETVTLSIRHAFSNRFRGLASVEWSNWSRFDNVPVLCTAQNLLVAAVNGNCAGGADTATTLEANWDDGWFYSLGFEYDYQPGLTVRGGVAYEESPTQTPGQRLFQVPDSNRIWLSAGLSYKMWANTTLDFAYTHIFVEDASVRRGQLLNDNFILNADREASVDIVSVGYKVRWGGRQPLK